MNDAERFNLLWNTDLTQEEYKKILEENPNLWGSYYLMEQLASELINGNL